VSERKEVFIRVEAIDSETGEPIAFARVELWKDARVKGGKIVASKAEPDYVGSTDADGIASFRVEPGYYVVALKSQMWSPVAKEVEITSDGVITIKSVKAFV